MNIWALFNGYNEDYKPRFYLKSEEAAKKLKRIYDYTHGDSATIAKIKILEDDDKLFDFPDKVWIGGFVYIDESQSFLDILAMQELSYGGEEFYDEKCYGISGFPKEKRCIRFEEVNPSPLSSEPVDLAYYEQFGFDGRNKIHFYLTMDTIQEETSEELLKRAKKFVEEKFNEYNKPFIKEYLIQKEEEKDGYMRLGPKIKNYGGLES